MEAVAPVPLSAWSTYNGSSGWYERPRMSSIKHRCNRRHRSSRDVADGAGSNMRIWPVEQIDIRGRDGDGAATGWGQEVSVCGEITQASSP